MNHWSQATCSVCHRSYPLAASPAPGMYVKCPHCQVLHEPQAAIPPIGGSSSLRPLPPKPAMLGHNPARRRDSGGFPWVILGIIGLIGVVGLTVLIAVGLLLVGRASRQAGDAKWDQVADGRRAFEEQMAEHRAAAEAAHQAAKRQIEESHAQMQADFEARRKARERESQERLERMKQAMQTPVDTPPAAPAIPQPNIPQPNIPQPNPLGGRGGPDFTNRPPFGRGGFPGPSGPRTGPSRGAPSRPATGPGSARPVARPPRTGTAGSLEEVLEAIQDPNVPAAAKTGRLMRLAAMPVDEQHRGKVVAAVAPFLNPAGGAAEFAAQSSAVRVVERWGLPEHVKQLKPLLGSQNFSLRHVTVRAISKLGGVEAAQVLVDCLSDPSLRSLVASEVGRLKPEAEAPLIALLAASDDPAVQREVVRLLGRVGGVAAVEALKELNAQTQDPSLKRATESSLRQITP